MTKALNSTAIADEICVDCGYEPELKRTLNSFQVFAISFAAMSVAIGIFSTYDDVLKTSGPVGIWLFLVVLAGQLFIALVYAQFAARIPLTGSAYQWGSRLANPKIGWIFGWVAACGTPIGIAAIDSALASQAFMPLFGIPPNERTARLIALIAMAIQTVIAIYSTRIVGWINSAAVCVELVIVVVLGIALVIVAVTQGGGSTSNLTSRGIAEHAPNYFGVGGGLMMAMIMGLATLVGFEAAANMAEEAKDPFRSVPRAILGSLIASGVLGMLFVIALTVSIKDIARTSASGSAVALIIHDQLGPVMERFLLVGIVFAFFGGGLVAMVTAPRIVFAMSRDERFPAHRLMRRVHARTQTPVSATILIFTAAIILIFALPGDALMPLIEASAIGGTTLYGMTVILYLAVRKRLDRREGAFELGRFEVPVAVGALVWVAIVLFVVISASASLVPVLITVGLFLAGGVYFAYLWFAKREVLDREPGEDIFDVDEVVTE